MFPGEYDARRLDEKQISEQQLIGIISLILLQAALIVGCSSITGKGKRPNKKVNGRIDSIRV
ncbi:MAG TPA: hypothetical protein VI306_09320 [Pyrinomonadaceae bacterium]